MSKSTNGANITAEDILRMNPDLLGQVGQAPPQSIPEPMPEPASMTTDQAIANFYGSGDRITQPDMAYYDEFPLPGDTGRAPAPELPQQSSQAGYVSAAGSSAMPAFQQMQTPAEVLAAMARLSRGGVGGRKNLMERRQARELVDRFETNPSSFAPPSPINLAGVNLSGQGPMAQPAVMQGRGPMVPIFDLEEMERGMRFGR